MKKKRKTIVLISAVLLLGVGMVAATLGDLHIGDALYNPAKVLAILMEVVGWWPVVVSPLLLCMYYITGHEEELGSPRAKSGLCYVLGAAVVLAMFGYSYYRMRVRGWSTGLTDVRTWICVATVLIFVTLLWRTVRSAGRKTRMRIWFVGEIGTVLTVENLALITALKMVWQRARYDMLVTAGSTMDFTPWYWPFARGGDSFPSGHVADAVSMLMLISLCDVWPRMEKYRGFLYVVAWAYISYMAYTRLVLGAHFLSDVIMGAAIVALMFYHLRRQPFYNKAMAKVLSEQG